MRHGLIVAGILLLLASGAAAQDADRIARLEARIAALEKRLEVLESRLAGPSDPAVAPGAVPGEVLQTIRAQAKDRYPDNFVMQRGLIKSQVKAWQELQGMEVPVDVPADIFRRIRTQAKDRYPDNFVMQRGLVKSQVKAYRAVQ